MFSIYSELSKIVLKGSYPLHMCIHVNTYSEDLVNFKKVKL